MWWLWHPRRRCVLWHFDELSEFARSDHGGFNATSDRGQTRISSLGPHVRFRRVQTLVREGSPLVCAILLSAAGIRRRSLVTDIAALNCCRNARSMPVCSSNTAGSRWQRGAQQRGKKRALVRQVTRVTRVTSRPLPARRKRKHKRRELDPSHLGLAYPPHSQGCE